MKFEFQIANLSFNVNDDEEEEDEDKEEEETTEIETIPAGKKRLGTK